MPAYNGGLFDTEIHPLLEEWKISDFYLARVIDCLGRAPAPDQDEDKHFLVDYRDLAIQYLGGIYEGLLEVHPRLAKVDMVDCSRTSKGVRVAMRERRDLPEIHAVCLSAWTFQTEETSVRWRSKSELPAEFEIGDAFRRRSHADNEEAN